MNSSKRVKTFRKLHRVQRVSTEYTSIIRKYALEISSLRDHAFLNYKKPKSICQKSVFRKCLRFFSVFVSLTKLFRKVRKIPKNNPLIGPTTSNLP